MKDSLVKKIKEINDRLLHILTMAIPKTLKHDENDWLWYVLVFSIFYFCAGVIVVISRSTF